MMIVIYYHKHQTVQVTEASEDWEMSSHTTAGDVGIKV